MRNKGYFGNLTGSSNWAGVTTVLSGTTIASVSAGAARSGSIILLQPTNYLDARTLSGSGYVVPLVSSVSVGGFHIVMAGSYAPKSDLAVAWAIVRR